jgi:hypothetical protein
MHCNRQFFWHDPGFDEDELITPNTVANPQCLAKVINFGFAMLVYTLVLVNVSS